MYTTDMYEGMIAETITMTGHGGAEINAYLAKPIGDGPFPGVVLIHHLPGWDELYREFTRRFAHHGYQAICPNLYFLGSRKKKKYQKKINISRGELSIDFLFFRRP